MGHKNIKILEQSIKYNIDNIIYTSYILLYHDEKGSYSS